MTNKAISTVIATVLMLMITITLTGTAYLYISGTFTGKTSTTFSLIDSFNDTVTIRNDGTTPITKITSTLDGNPVNIAITPQIQGLVASWSMNEGSGSTTADNFDNNVGVLMPSCPDCPSWVIGRYGNALRFDGTNDYVNIISNFDIANKDFTIETWYMPNSAITYWATVISIGGTGYGNSYNIIDGRWLGGLTPGSLNDNGRPYTEIFYNSYITIGNWNHIVIKHNKTENKIYAYVNGQYVDYDSYTGNLQTPNNNVKFGTGDNYFNGVIDEVRVYNKALSEEEIKSLYLGLVSPGQSATIKPLTTLTKGTHTLRLCTSSMCNAAILMIN